MTLLLIESFDAGDWNLPGKWNSFAGLTVNTTDARFAGTNSAQSSNAIIGSILNKQLDPADEHATLLIGFAMRVVAPAEGDTSKTLLQFASDNGVTAHVTVLLTAAGAIKVLRGSGSGTLLGTSANSVITASVWGYIEVKVVLHDTTGSIHVRYNNIEVLALTGIDTKNAGTKAVFDQIKYAGGGISATTRVRDIYIANGAGSVNNDFLGDSRVTFRVPNADSTPEQFALSSGADSFALVDEATPNSDTDYIQSAVDGEVTRLGLEDLADTTHVVKGVQASVYARKDDAGSRSMRIGMFSDATLANGSDKVLGTSYAVLREMFELDPDGAVPWTPAQLNAAFVQVEARP